MTLPKERRHTHTYIHIYKIKAKPLYTLGYKIIFQYHMAFVLQTKNVSATFKHLCTKFQYRKFCFVLLWLSYILCQQSDLTLFCSHKYVSSLKDDRKKTKKKPKKKNTIKIKEIIKIYKLRLVLYFAFSMIGNHSVSPSLKQHC